MQYTDNEAALIGGLISTYFLRPAVSAALKVASFLPLTLRSIFITSLTVSEGFFGGGFLLLIYYIANA